MPLIKSTSKKAREENIETEIKAGKKPSQAVAIGYSEQREAKHKRSTSDGHMPERHTRGTRMAAEKRSRTAK